MHIAMRPHRARTLIFALMAFLVASLATLQTLPANASPVNAIDMNSITLSNQTSPGQPIARYDTVRISANWAIPDGSGQAGQTFTLGLPEPLKGNAGSFQLKGTGPQADVVFGDCAIEATQVVCTLSDAVAGKNNVRGELWVQSQAHMTYDRATLTFTLNGGVTREVPLPEDATRIGESTYVPTEAGKLGYFQGDDLVWRVIVPGSVVSGGKLSIHDPYAAPGFDFTVKDAVFYKMPNTNYCWNNNTADDCRTVLWSKDGGTTGAGGTAGYDDSLDKAWASVDAVDADALYSLELRLTIDTPLYPGMQFVNEATVNGTTVSEQAEYEAVGGGTGSGDTIGHLTLEKKVDGGNVPADAVFPVKYSYEQGGKTREGVLELKANTKVWLRNILDGTVVTLTEETPTGTDAKFADPVFSGEGLTDGGATSRGATVTVKGTKTLELTLTNPVENTPKITLAKPQVDPGVCRPGSTTPTDPTVSIASTEGIAYSQPVIKTEGGKATVTVTATPEGGKAIDDKNLPQGWTYNNDGTATYTKTVDVPECAPTPVAPQNPTVELGVCKDGAITPTDPTITAASTEGLDYSVSWAVDGDQVVFSATATAKAGYAIDKDNLPNGWTWDEGNKVAKFEQRVNNPVCATPVVPVTPTVTPGVCKAGSTTPTEPTVDLATTEGIEYSWPTITTANGEVTITVTATRKGAHYIDGGNLPQGWTYNNDGTATYTEKIAAPDCAKPATPVAPSVLPGVCEAGSETPTAPSASVVPATGVSYGDPVIKTDGGKFTVSVQAKAEAGYRFADDLGSGWTRVDDFTATFSGEYSQPDCAKKVVVPVAPTVTPGVCEAGSTTPTKPTVTLAQTPGVVYDASKIEVVDGLATITVTAKPQGHNKFSADRLDEGWTLNSDGSATYVGKVAQPTCLVPATPQDPKIVPGVCKPGSETPAPPAVSVPNTPGLVYGTPKITENGGKVKITVKVTPKPGHKLGDMGPNWKLNKDGSATYTYEGKTPECKMPGLPKTGD